MGDWRRTQREFQEGFQGDLMEIPRRYGGDSKANSRESNGEFEQDSEET